MLVTLYVVRYSGPFGFIKPWTAVRDGLTFSQPYITPSIVEGMRQKLGVAAILRHRLTHDGLCPQQEHVQSAGWAPKNASGGKALVRNTGVLTRYVMINPTLHLAFGTAEDAETAASDHLCLCRNEDLVFPVDMAGQLVNRLSEAEFDTLQGFEVRPGDGPGSIPLGVNRYTAEAMRGRIVVGGQPHEAEP